MVSKDVSAFSTGSPQPWRPSSAAGPGNQGVVPLWHKEQDDGLLELTKDRKVTVRTFWKCGSL